MTKKIVISEFMDEAAVDSLRTSFDVLYDPELALQRPALARALQDAHGLIVRNRTQVDGELAGAGKLVAVGRLGVGLENIDQDCCSRRSVAVIPAVGANAAAVAEYVISMAMVLMRGFLFSSASVAQGLWPRAELASGLEAAGKTMAIVGFGSVGQSVGKLAQAMNMRVIAYDPVPPPGTRPGSTLCADRTSMPCFAPPMSRPCICRSHPKTPIWSAIESWRS